MERQINMSELHIDKLEDMSEDELMAYVRSRLLGEMSEPMVAWSHGELPEQFLIDAYALSTHHDFRSRLKQVVKQLLTGWRPELHDDIEYGGRLIYLLGRLGVEGGEAILDQFAAEPLLEQLTIDHEPVKNLVLRTLLDFPGQESRTDLWEPLLDDPQYFDTAFLAMSSRGWKEGLRALPQYLQMALQTGLNDGVIEIRLSHFISRCQSLDRLPALRRTLAELGSEAHGRVQAILKRTFPEVVEQLNVVLEPDAPPNRGLELPFTVNGAHHD